MEIYSNLFIQRNSSNLLKLLLNDSFILYYYFNIAVPNLFISVYQLHIKKNFHILLHLTTFFTYSKKAMFYIYEAFLIIYF